MLVVVWLMSQALSLLKSSSKRMDPIPGRSSGVAEGTIVRVNGVVVAVGGNQITVEVGSGVIDGAGEGIRVPGANGWQPLNNSNPKIESKIIFIRY